MLIKSPALCRSRSESPGRPQAEASQVGRWWVSVLKCGGKVEKPQGLYFKGSETINHPEGKGLLAKYPVSLLRLGNLCFLRDIAFTTGMSGWKQVVGRLPNTINPTTSLDSWSRDQAGSPGLWDN